MDIIGLGAPDDPLITFQSTDPNPAMFNGKPISWVRDTAAANVTSGWQTTYRDVVILDPLNQKIDVFNLTLNSLTGTNGPANKAALKGKLLAAATPVDTDNDKLPDYWELWAYGNLDRNPGTTGGDGLKTLLHYAHCSTAPGAGVLPGLPRMVVVQEGSETSATVLWSRRRGTAFGLTVTPEFSTSLAAWTDSAHGYEDWSSRKLYDGSGGEVIAWRSTLPNPFRFSRLKVVLP